MSSVRWTWTADNVSIQNFRESQATAMALDSTGDYVLLAGRRGLDVVTLPDMPQCRPLRVKHKTVMKWDISVAEWNPHPQQKNQFVTASNQTADVFVQRESDWVQEVSLRAHTRSISNLNWAVFDPHLLATCSVDTYIYIWDIREPKKPSSSFSTFAGAGQVKWNKRDRNCLATVHDGDIRLWDKRKGNQPVKYISAHLSKIYSLDWDPHHESHLITASQDCSAKVWDINNEQKAFLELRTEAAQWKARFTPFGDGIITIAMPQLRQRENNLLMWSQGNLSAPIHSFTGHTDDILEFQWRPKDVQSSDYHMVTWARDYSLRIWRVEPHLLRLCGVEVQDLNLSGSSDMEILASPPKFPSVTIVSSSPARQHPLMLSGSEMLMGGDQSRSLNEQDTSITSLEQEFNLVSRVTGQTSIEPHLESRTCLISVSSNEHHAWLKMSFPHQYPVKASPQLTILPATTLDNQTRNKVLEVLNHSCRQQVEKDRFCISGCVNKLITIMEGLQLNTSSTTNGPSTKQSNTSGSQVAAFYGTAADKNVPFPRTSGARFCSTDKLIMFTRPSTLKRSSVTFQMTPKALSALSHVKSSGRDNQEALSITRFYRDRESKLRRGGKHRRKNSDVSQMSPSSLASSGVVVVFDTSCLLPIHQKLAETYVIIPDNVPLMCSLNAKAAGAVGRKDLVQVWSLASLASSPNLRPDLNPDAERPWARHPMGRQLIKALIDHYSAIHDVQTLAMLSCAFGDCQRVKQRRKNHSNSPMIRRFFVAGGSDPFSPEWTDEFCQSQSFGDSPDDYKFGRPTNPEEMEEEVHRDNVQLLDPDQRHQLDKFKRKYAEILYKWNLLEARADLLKYTSYPESPRNSRLEFSDFGAMCRKCRKRSPSVTCQGCKKSAFECSICHVAVRGASTFCLACGHGGHTQHMLDWFRNETWCPTGCGCECERESLRVCQQDVCSLSPITVTVGMKR